MYDGKESRWFCINCGCECEENDYFCSKDCDEEYNKKLDCIDFLVGGVV